MMVFTHTGQSHMMSTTAVIGLSAGKRLLTTSFFGYDLNEKLSLVSDHGFTNYQQAPAKSAIAAKKSSDYGPSFSSSNRQKQSVNALKQCLDTTPAPSTADKSWEEICDDSDAGEDSDMEYSVDALLLLQKSMLEKQWNLSAEQKTCNKLSVVCSGTSARQRRINSKGKLMGKDDSVAQTSTSKQSRTRISPEVTRNKKRYKGYGKGYVSKQYLSHPEVVSLSMKVQEGLSLDKHKLRLQEKLGYEPTDKELSMSLKISRAELHAKLIECNSAKEKLAMNYVRLVISIAKQYENTDAEMEDLVQGGMFGLLRGIEKFDATKGFKMSTYVYWWIRQNIAQLLNMTEKKVTNATQAMIKVLSLDREAFPSLDGSPGHTHHSYVADTSPDNDPRQILQKWVLKEEINNILNIALGEREREIISLYYGLQGRPLTWEEISKQIGLSRERVRQIGLVALEKVRHVARDRNLEATLEIHEYEY